MYADAYQIRLARYNPVMPAETAKDRALEAIRALPDRATIEDAIEKLCFIAKIEASSEEFVGKLRLGQFAK